MKTSPCAQRKRLAAGGCPALADSLGRQGQGCGQEDTPASHLLSPLPIATSPSISGQLEGGDFKCHLPPPKPTSAGTQVPTPTETQEGQNNVAWPLGWGRRAGGGMKGQWSHRRGPWGSGGNRVRAQEGATIQRKQSSGRQSPTGKALLGHPTCPAPAHRERLHGPQDTQTPVLTQLEPTRTGPQTVNDSSWHGTLSHQSLGWRVCSV